MKKTLFIILFLFSFEASFGFGLIEYKHLYSKSKIHYKTSIKKEFRIEHTYGKSITKYIAEYLNHLFEYFIEKK